jgi:hypothetical protein
MTAATILTILDIVSSLFGVIAEAPAVIEEIKSLLAKVQPYVDAANGEVQRAFEDAQQRLKEVSP